MLGPRGIQVLPRQEGLRAGQPGKNLVGASQVELGQIGNTSSPLRKPVVSLMTRSSWKGRFLSLSGG